SLPFSCSLIFLWPIGLPEPSLSLHPRNGSPPLAGRRATLRGRRSRGACLSGGLPSGSASGHLVRGRPTVPPTFAACKRDILVVVVLGPVLRPSDTLPLFAANSEW